MPAAAAAAGADVWGRFPQDGGLVRVLLTMAAAERGLWWGLRERLLDCYSKAWFSSSW